jgi:hypothetical protein
MRRRISRRMLTGGLVAVLALAAVIPALGTSVGPFNSEGCSVTGNTSRPSGGTSMRSTSSAFYSGGGECGWTYVSALYYQGGTWNGYAPGWNNDGTADTGTQTNVLDAVAAHSGCHAGGPCSNAVYQNTYD